MCGAAGKQKNSGGMETSAASGTDNRITDETKNRVFRLEVADDDTITYTNTLIGQRLRIKVVNDEEPAVGLGGAKFSIACENQDINLANLSSSEAEEDLGLVKSGDISDGLLFILPFGDSYTIQETEAPRYYDVVGRAQAGDDADKLGKVVLTATPKTDSAESAVVLTSVGGSETDQTGATLTSQKDDKGVVTYLVFRNAHTDVVSECGGDYLTGQEGDAKNLIKWTGGFDFVFRKIDGYAEPLPGATFTLYMSAKDASGNDVIAVKDATTGNLRAAESTETNYAAYQQTNKATGNKEAATGTSGNIAQGDAVTIKVNKGTVAAPVIEDKLVYGNGLAAFYKIPPGVYFLKETAFPKVSDSGATKYEPAEEMYKVDLNGKGYFTIYVKGEDESWTTEAPSTLFKNDGTVTDSSSTDTLAVYNLMNVDPRKQKVILRKVEKDTYTSLAGARFRIFRADLTEITEGQPVDSATGQKKGYYESQSSGVYFIDKLPFGKYYLVETKGPSGYGNDLNKDKVFTLEVKADGMTNTLTTNQKIDNEATDETLKKLYHIIHPATP